MAFTEEAETVVGTLSTVAPDGGFVAGACIPGLSSAVVGCVLWWAQQCCGWLCCGGLCAVVGSAVLWLAVLWWAVCCGGLSSAVVGCVLWWAQRGDGRWQPSRRCVLVCVVSCNLGTWGSLPLNWALWQALWHQAAIWAVSGT